MTLPEMKQHAGLRQPPLFMPIVADFYKGLAVTVPLHLGQLAAGHDSAAVHRCLRQRYDPG